MSTVSMKRHRTEVPTQSSDDDSGTDGGPTLADSIAISSKTLELIAGTFATTNKAAFDVLQASSKHIVEQPLATAIGDLTSMTKVATTATSHMITATERYRTATNDVEHLRAQVALRDEALRSQLGTVTDALHQTGAPGGSIVAFAIPMLQKNTSMWQRQCERLTSALASVRETSASEESKLRDQVRSLEKQVADGRVRTARLQASLDCASNAAAGHQHEVMGLVQVMEQVVKRTRENAGCIVDLARSRAQVRKLQKFLTLKDIAAALTSSEEVAGENEATHLLTEGLPPSAAVRPPMPGAAVKAVAPSFYALRVLQHKDISVAELVDDWLVQGDKIQVLESDLLSCTTALEKLQREANKTHSLYTEERRRREAEERRVAELQRQRLMAAGSGPAAVAELDKIRLQVSTLLDTNAILTVQLRHARMDCANADTHAEAYRATIRELEAAGHADAVVQSVAAMKVHYEREASRLHSETITIAQALEEARQTLQATQGCAQAERVAREQQQTAFEATTMALKKSESLLTRVLKASNECSARASEKDEKISIDLLKHSSQSQEPLISGKLSRGSAAAMSERIYALLQNVVGTLQDLEADARTNGKDGDVANVATTPPSDHSYALQELRRALHAALTFTTVQMEASIEGRKYMVDAHVADAQAISMLHEELKRTQNQLEKATLDLEKCQEFIERHGLRAVESVLMHELDQPDPSSPKHGKSSHGDSGGAMLAREELETLRAQLQEQTVTAARLARHLEEREMSLEALTQEIRKSKAMELAASKRAELWKHALESERGTLRSLSVVLRSVTSVNSLTTDNDDDDVVVAHNDEPLSDATHKTSHSHHSEVQYNEETNNGEKEQIDVDDDDDGVATETVEGVADDEDFGELQSTAAVRGDNDDDAQSAPPPTDEQDGGAVVALRDDEVDEEQYALVELQDLPPGPLTADALSPLIHVLASVTKTLDNIKTGLDHLVNPPTSSKSSALASLSHDGEGNASSSAATSLEDIVAERIANDGIASVGSLVREIYETAGVIRRQRASLAGADAAQQSETHQLMVDALQRKCSVLEAARQAQEAASAASMRELQQEKERVDAELQNALRSRDQLLVERDRAIDQAVQSHQIEAAKRYDALAAEFQSSKAQFAETNGKLLGFVKALQARLASAPPPTGPPASQPPPQAPAAGDAAGAPPPPTASS
jgi:hypothetical protein